MVIAEATGGYERALMHMLYKYNISVALIKSSVRNQRRHFIDAKMLLRFAKEKKPKPTEYVGVERETLIALMDRRSQLTA